MDSFLMINDQPCFMLGGQVHNSSAYNAGEMETAWKALTHLKANVVEFPVYWEQIEPSEGQFQFDQLDDLIMRARQQKLHVVLLWFGTWKNGSMQYVPDWVKTNPERFQPVITPAGNAIWVLSSHSENNWQADCSAFTALMSHIKSVDSQEKTVIAVQIENEPGILGCVRDHSRAAEDEFLSAVPSNLMEIVRRKAENPIHQAWQAAGTKRGGNWSKVFGEHAEEIFSAWSIATYIDRLAQAGKEVYPLPMYVNVWLGEQGWQMPGVDYPSGGATLRVLDLWKWAAPFIDLIAPDIYIQSVDSYRDVCSGYSGDDNPLFIPESGQSLAHAVNMFEAIGRFGAVGYAVFGIESLLDANGNPKPENQALIDSFQCAAAALPLINQYHGSQQMQAVVQHEYMYEQRLDLGDHLGMVRFLHPDGREHMDFRNTGSFHDSRGRGLVFSVGDRELFMVGSGYRLMLKRKTSEQHEFSKAHDHFDGPLTHYRRVEEGHFSEDGTWVVDRVRNGDEITNGLWVTPQAGVVHALLAD